MTGCNCRGDLVQQIDAQNRVTTNSYDPLARLTAQTDASGAITTSIFDPAGRLLARQNPRGYFTSYAYDSLNRQTGAQDPTGVWTTAVYDSRSNKIADIDGLGYRTTALYDNLSRQIGQQNALGYRSTTVYNNLSLPIATIDPLGHIRTTIYDVLKRPQAIQRPDGAFVTTVYDANSNPIASISPLGFISTQAYDTRNRLIGRQDPLGRWHSVTYDNAGRLWMQQDGKGQITTRSYLNCGDEYTRLYADNTCLTFSYNSLRQLTGVADPTGLHTFSYDVLGRLVSFVGPAHPNGQAITYGYDPNSNRTLVQGWEGRQTYTYDPRDLLTVVQDPGAPVYGVASGFTTISYDPRHLWLQQTNANGTHSTVTYDPLQRFSQIRHSNAANAEIAHSFYNYDAAGRLTLLQTEAGTFTYGYDVLDQLTGEISSYPAPTPYSPATSYSYDANLRRIGVHSAGVLTTATYDAADQLRVLQTTTTFTLPYTFGYADPLLWSQVNPWTTFSYDANGSPVTMMSGLFLTSYSWDAANRLKSVSLPDGGTYTQTYRFDDLRQRRQGPANIDTFVYAVTDPATQRDGLVGLGSALSTSPATGSAAGTVDNSASARWSSEAAPLLWWQRSGAASEWLVQTGGGSGLVRSVGQSATGGALNRQYHLDALGNTAATSTGTGTTETTLTYDAWGNRLYPTPGPFPGTPVGNVAFTAAATGFGEALSLTFSNRGYIALPPSVWTPSTAFSVSCRIQSTYSGSNPAMILGVSSPVAPQQFWLGLVNGVVYVFGYNLSTWVVGTTAVDDGNWHTVLATYSGGVWTLYVDGSQNATGSGTYVSEPSVHVAIGALPIAGTYEFTGLIDEVAIFNTVISSTPVPTSPWANNTSGLVALYHLDGNLEDSAQTSVNDNRQGYVGGSGYWQEPELGLAYVRARWLNESTGSWLSVDPVSSEPRYSYVHNMPTTLVDPSGRGGFFDYWRRQLQQAVNQGRHVLQASFVHFLQVFGVSATDAERMLGFLERLGTDIVHALNGLLDALREGAHLLSASFQSMLRNLPPWVKRLWPDPNDSARTQFILGMLLEAGETLLQQGLIMGLSLAVPGLGLGLLLYTLTKLALEVARNGDVLGALRNLFAGDVLEAMDYVQTHGLLDNWFRGVYFMRITLRSIIDVVMFFLGAKGFGQAVSRGVSRLGTEEGTQQFANVFKQLSDNPQEVLSEFAKQAVNNEKERAEEFRKSVGEGIKQAGKHLFAPGEDAEEREASRLRENGKAAAKKAKKTAQAQSEASTIKRGKYLGAGGNKTVYAVEGQEDAAIAVLKPGKPSDLIDEEIKILEAIRQQGLPTVEVLGETTVDGRPAIVMKRYAQGSKEIVKTIDGKPRTVGSSPFLNKTSVSDLESIMATMEERNVKIDDLQFLIGRDGHVVIADPLAVRPGEPPSRANIQTIKLLIAAAQKR